MNTVYGKTAIAAAKELQKDKNADPRKVWDISIIKFTDSKESKNKGCPRTTFLALCEDGNIRDVPANTNLQISSKNADYARQMIQDIKSKKGKINSKKDLWEIVKHPDKAKMKTDRAAWYSHY